MPRTPRQMHGRRVFAAAAAAGLLVSLFAPWYRWTVVAPGVTGLRTLTVTRSGWQAFSGTELVILVVAALTLLVVIGMPADDPDDGAPDRRRLAGVIVTALGAIALVVVLARLTTAPGTTKHALDETMVAIRWGIFLALACCAALTLAGLRLARASRHTARVARTERPPRAERPPRHERVPRPKRAHRTDRVSRTERVPRQGRAPTPDRARPSAARTDGPAPPGPAPVPAPERRSEGARSARRNDRPLWDEHATGWLDLPD